MCFEPIILIAIQMRSRADTLNGGNLADTKIIKSGWLEVRDVSSCRQYICKRTTEYTDSGEISKIRGLKLGIAGCTLCGLDGYWSSFGPSDARLGILERTVQTERTMYKKG